MIRAEREGRSGRVGYSKTLAEGDDRAMPPSTDTNPGDVNGVGGVYKVIEAGSVDREVPQDLKSVLVVGAGPAGLMLALVISLCRF
jgi:NADPH-dependent 2,4-dienoyl-CoA reductase/sulfur reductase-like enzyme